MPVGTVKWFDANKGYGFIGLGDGTGDVFVHISALKRSGLQTLKEGEMIQYEVVQGRNGKTAAENLKTV